MLGRSCFLGVCIAVLVGGSACIVSGSALEPMTRVVPSENSNFIVRIEPGFGLERNAVARIYKYRNKSYRKQVAFELINTISPKVVRISDDGRLFTVGNWGAAGWYNQVVTYSRKGHLVKAFHLDDLYQGKNLLKIRRLRSGYSIDWICYKAAPCFHEDTFAVFDSIGGIFDFSLDGKSFTYRSSGVQECNIRRDQLPKLSHPTQPSR